MNFLFWYNKTYEKVIKANKYPSDINLIIYSVLNGMKEELVNNNYILSEKEIFKLNNLVEEYLSTDKPIGYIVGFEIFLNNVIFVDQNTLIPRFETEELVLLAVSKIKANYLPKSKITILDICTGSGVIAISMYKLLEKEYDIEIILSDISPEALKVAKHNLKYHNINKYRVIESDMLDKIIELDIKCDVLTANPPYIDITEEVQESVMKYEPHLALFADDEGLYFYKKIVENMNRVLNEKSLVFFEIGSLQAQKINEYGKIKIGKKFQVIKDINKNDRILFMENNDNR